MATAEPQLIFWPPDSPSLTRPFSIAKSPKRPAATSRTRLRFLDILWKSGFKSAK